MPQHKAVPRRRRKKLFAFGLLFVVCVRKIESCIRQAGKCAVEVVSVELALADRLDSYRKERLAVNNRHAVLAQFASRRVVRGFADEERLARLDGVSKYV